MPALNQGFRLIADYIFCNNLSSEKMAMTARVTQDGSAVNWKVQFVIPEGDNLETLPKPKNPAIRLITVSARIGVVRFSGFNTDKTIYAHRKIFLRYIAGHHLSVVGLPTTAFYNPPWTLTFFRRNEIMLELP